MAASVTHSLATVSDTWETELAPPGLPDDLTLILQDSQGANLDVATIDLLTASGVYDAKSFILFTQEPFSELLSTLSDSHFFSLSGDKLCNAQLYSHYLVEHRLVQTDGTVDTTTFDWHAYYSYWHCHRRQVGISFNTAYQLEAEAHRQAQLAQPIRHGPPSVVTALITHDTGVDTTVTPTPVPHAPLPPPSISDDEASIYTPLPHPSPQPQPFPPPDILLASTMMRGGMNTPRTSHILADPDSAFSSQLFWKVTPKSIDLQNYESDHFDQDTFPFTPPNGNPAIDIGTDYRLQNPYVYGYSQKVKQLPMISMKIKWNR